MKRLFCALICFVMVLGLALPVMAAKEMFQIRSVSLNVTAPKVGQNPVFQASVATENVFVVTDAPFPFVNGVNWHQYNPDNDLVESNTFQGGLRYKVTVRVRARTSSGGSFLKDANGMPNITGTINGVTASVATVPGTTDVDLTLQFAALPKTLTTAGVTGIDAPVTGAAPDYTATVNSSDYKFANMNDSLFKNGITWYDCTDSKYVSTSHKFIAGHTYMVEVHLVPTGSGTFSDDATGSVNGKDIGVVAGGGDEIALVYEFPTCADNQLMSASVKGIDAPVAGQTLDYTATVGSSDYKLLNKNNTTFKNGITWYDATDMKYVSTSHKAIAGHSYTVEVHLVPTGSKTFSDSATGSVNGINIGEVSGGGSEIALVYDFSACEEKQSGGAPVITLQPQNPVWPEYSYAEYTVKASGSDITATWYIEYNGKTYNISDMTNGWEPWESYAGETYGPVTESKNVFTCFFGGIEGELGGAQLYCVLSNSAGQVTSSKAVISISGSAQPPVTEVPVSVTGYKGDVVEVTCKATGKGLSYIWYETGSGKLQDITAVDRGTANAATFRPDTSKVGTRYYVCGVTNSAGGLAYSSVIPVKILEKKTNVAEPEITTKTLKAAVVGKEYSAKLECTDPDAAFSIWFNPGKSNDFDKTGLVLTQHGTLEGTPQKAGTYTFCVCAAGEGGEGYMELTLTVAQKEEDIEETEPTEQTQDPTEDAEETEEESKSKDKKQDRDKDQGGFKLWWILIPIGLFIGAVCVTVVILIIKKANI